MLWTTLYKTLSALGIIAIATGCDSSPATSTNNPPTTTITADTPSPIKPSGAAAAAQGKPALGSLDLQKLLCQDKNLCKLLRNWDAGRDAANQPMQIVEITLNSTITEALKTSQSYYDENDERQCEPLQYWFVQPTLVDTKAQNADPTLLLELCNDGYGAAHIGEDTIEVSPNRFTHSQMGGSASRWSQTTTIELPSFRLLEESTNGWHNLFRERDNTIWNWTNMTGQNNGFTPGCEDNEIEDREKEDPDNYAYEPILVFPSLPKDFRNNGWKNTRLDTCSTLVSSSIDPDYSKSQSSYFGTGFITHGDVHEHPDADRHTDASFKVVMASPTEIYVEITDNIWIETAPSILHADHLELWARTETVCPKATTKNLFQWGITLDGKVQTLYGKPAQSPTAERVLVKVDGTTKTYRFKITLPEAYDAITLVYSDSDNGTQQERLIATSRIKYRDQFTLGQVKEISPDTGTCQIQNNALKYIPTPKKPTTPVIQ